MAHVGRTLPSWGSRGPFSQKLETLPGKEQGLRTARQDCPRVPGHVPFPHSFLTSQEQGVLEAKTGQAWLALGWEKQMGLILRSGALELACIQDK